MIGPMRRTDVARWQRPGQPWAAGGYGLIGLVVLFFALGDGRAKVTAVSLAGCVACLGAYWTTVRLVPEHYVPRLLISGYALQFVALAAIAMLGLPLSPPYHPFEVSAADAPVTAAFAMAMAVVGVVLAAAAWRVVGPRAPLVAERHSAEGAAKERRLYLVLAAVAHLLYWPAALDDSGVAGYVVRIIATALVVAPFLAGRDSQKDRVLASLWSATILINAIIGIAAGTRSKAFLAVVLFVAGYISALPKRRRLVIGSCALIAMLPLVQLAGAVGAARERLGRGGLELMRQDHLGEVLRELSHWVVPSFGEDAEEVNTQGVSRLLTWTNVVVPIMTPDSVPYRRLDGVLDEVKQMFHIASISGATVDDLYDAGLGVGQARPYGFTVNSSTAVEFSLAADGWSRGGAPFVVLFSLVAGLALTAAEWCVGRWRGYPGISSILALPIARAAFFDANVLPLFAMLRGMILSIVLITVLVMLAELARRSGRSVSHRPRPAWTSVETE